MKEQSGEEQSEKSGKSGVENSRAEESRKEQRREWWIAIGLSQEEQSGKEQSGE